MGVYYDDSIVFSNSRSEHLGHLEEIFRKCVQYGLQINLQKCQFMRNEVEFLGHHVNAQEIKPLTTNKISEVVQFNVPLCVSEVKSFLRYGLIFQKVCAEIFRVRSTVI